MSRSGYSEDCDNDWQVIIYRGAVKSAIRGRRGQAFFRDLLAALDALPDKKLIYGDLVNKQGAVCALGALGQARHIDMNGIDPEDASTVAETFGIAEALAREVVYMNDEASWGNETPERRFVRMREWTASQIKPEPAEPSHD